jgi:SAM-dependent methyltransferase
MSCDPRPEAAVSTHGHHESVLRSHRWRTAGNSAAYLLPSLGPGLTVLDVGCGPGTITADLAALVEPGRVTAVELTPDALDLARGEAAARRQGNIDFAVADVRATSSTWCFATPEDRQYWGGMWADRIVQSDLARQLRRDGTADEAELAAISAAWRAWAADDDGWFSLLHGEILCTP